MIIVEPKAVDCVKNIYLNIRTKCYVNFFNSNDRVFSGAVLPFETSLKGVFEYIQTHILENKVSYQYLALSLINGNRVDPVEKYLNSSFNLKDLVSFFLHLFYFICSITLIPDYTW